MEHIQNEALLVCYFSVEFKVVVTEHIFSESVIFEAGRILRPFEQDSLGIGGLGEITSLREGPFDCLVVVAACEIVVAVGLVEFLDGFHE